MAAPAELIEHLASDDAAVRRAAADELQDLGAAAVPWLITAALHHPRLHIRLGSIAGIGNLRQAGLPAAPAMASMLGDPDKQVRTAATRALISMGTVVVPLLQQVRAGGPGRARPAALYCLAELGGEKTGTERRAVDPPGWSPGTDR